MSRVWAGVRATVRAIYNGGRGRSSWSPFGVAIHHPPSMPRPARSEYSSLPGSNSPDGTEPLQSFRMSGLKACKVRTNLTAPRSMALCLLLHVPIYIALIFSWIALSRPGSIPQALPPTNGKYDVVIYGNTPAALAAAIQSVRMQKSVTIVCPESHIGGLTTSGLGWTDSKNSDAIGGIALEYYQRVFRHYQADAAWVRETRNEYMNQHINAQPGPAIDNHNRVQWTFEPHVAEQIWEDWMSDSRIPIVRGEYLDRSDGGVELNGAKIVSFKTLTGRVFKASMFIDASYEGDLMAAAGVPYRIGRESASEFNETLAGTRILNDNTYKGVDPYIEKGNSSSGLLSGIQRVLNHATDHNGTGDHRLQSYNYRMALTKNPENRIPFFKPDGFNESEYELLFRYIEDARYRGRLFTTQLMPNGKTDTNADGKVSTDLMGGNYNTHDGTSYANDTYQGRAAMAERHKVYTQGFFWALANHPRVPRRLRRRTSRWGYAKDEFASNGYWPYEIYIREGRRMEGLHTMTQDDVENPKRFPEDSVVGMGAYSLDVHEVERVVVDDQIYNGGSVHIFIDTPYAIPFKSLVPDARYATNLINPVTLGSTHIAFASIRMEPTYMILGQSAATAACLALDQGVGIQDVDRTRLTARLRRDSQVIS